MRRRILIIEDDVDIARMVDLHLKDAGYQVSLAHDGDTGLDQAINDQWDLIILDLMLPARTGSKYAGASDPRPCIRRC